MALQTCDVLCWVVSLGGASVTVVKTVSKSNTGQRLQQLNFSERVPQGGRGNLFSLSIDRSGIHVYSVLMKTGFDDPISLNSRKLSCVKQNPPPATTILPTAVTSNTV